MGRPNTIAKSNALTLTTDAQGNIKYDAILTQHHSDSSDRQLVVHSSLNDLKAKDIEESYDRPDEEAVKESANRTLNALERIVDSKHNRRESYLFILVFYRFKELISICYNSQDQGNSTKVARTYYCRRSILCSLHSSK